MTRSRKAKETAVLYSELGVGADATQDQIKSSYRKLALQFHPDKLVSKPEKEKQEATLKFQKVSQAYNTLSDVKLRKKYDETGDYSTSSAVNPPDDMSDYEAWDAFYKELWSGLVTKERVEEFKKEYQGSEEEKQDIINSYLASNGSIDKIFEDVMLSNPLEDEDRFRDILDEAITSKQIPRYAAFKKDAKATTRRKTEAEKEAKLAETELKKLEKESGKKIDDEDALKQLMLARGKSRMDDLVSRLEDKYSGNTSNGNTKKANGTMNGKSAGMVGNGKKTSRPRDKQDDDEENLGDEDSEVEDEEDDDDEEEWEDEDDGAEGDEGGEENAEGNAGDEGGTEDDDNNEEEPGAGDEEDETNEEDELDEESATASADNGSNKKAGLAGSSKKAGSKRKNEEVDELEDDFIVEEDEETTKPATTTSASSKRGGEPSETEFLSLRARIEAERKAKANAASSKSNTPQSKKRKM